MGSWSIGIGVFLVRSVGVAFPVVALVIVGVLVWWAPAAATGRELGDISGAIAPGWFGLLVVGGIPLAGLAEPSDAA